MLNVIFKLFDKYVHIYIDRRLCQYSNQLTIMSTFQSIDEYVYI